MIFQVLLFVIFGFSGNYCSIKKYDNYTLFRAIPVNKSHVEFFARLTEVYDVNFWRGPGETFASVDFVISPTDKYKFLNDAKKLGVYITVLNDDIQRAFDQQVVQSYVRRQMNTMNWLSFYRLQDIYDWLEDLSKAYPREIILETIGKSYENRTIMGVKVQLRGTKPRSIIMIEGGIHAREWISVAVVTYLINAIVTVDSTTDDKLKKIAGTYEWYFVPILNPDGYVYSHNYDRMWRKNRNGYGVDLNRNFGYGFGTENIVRPTSESYAGKKEFSEPESRAMAEFVKANSDRIEYYISFHSYGQLMILPYAQFVTHMENYEEVYKMCKEAAEKISEKYKTAYLVGTAFETLGYTAAGVSTCWVKKTFKTPYVVTFELRDRGNEGFALNPNKIRPTCEEIVDGLKSFLTPRTENLTKQTYTYFHRHSGQSFKKIDKIVIVNLIVLNTVLFDFY